MRPVRVIDLECELYPLNQVHVPADIIDIVEELGAVRAAPRAIAVRKDPARCTVGVCAVDYPDTLWCYGNHDVSYPWGRLETGYSPYAERMVISKFEELENSLKSPTQIDIMHRIDNVLFSHGGLTADFLKWLDEDLLDAEIDDVIAAVNDASHDFLWNDESPLWFRPQYETREIFRPDTYKQVVGHTPVEKIFEKESIISTDVFSTYGDGRQIGESAMIVIDSETGKYEKIEVMGKWECDSDERTDIAIFRFN